MAQSHNCAYLVPLGDQCRCDESCQYMLTAYNHLCGPIICGKDQLTGHIRENDPPVTSKDEPELMICDHATGCDIEICNHIRPHAHLDGCDKPTCDSKDGLPVKCIPYKCPPCSGPVWDNLNAALAEKDAEIAGLKDEIADLEDRIATQGRSIGNYQDRVAQQDQELKDLGKALEDAKKYDPFVCPRRQDACTGCLHTACPQRIERVIPPKDEPELWICPNSGKVLGCNGCSHAEPHRKDGYCHLGEPSGDCLHCIPYKEGTVNPGGNDPRIDTLAERVDAAVRELSDARQRVAAAKEVIRENIDLRDAIATLQAELQHERGNRTDMEREYCGKLVELHRSFETVAQALEDGRVKCAGLEKENAAIKTALKAVL